MTTPPHPASNLRRRTYTVIEACGLSCVWLLFSGKFDIVHLSYGAISVGLVLYLSRHLLIADDASRSANLLHRIRWGQAALYPFWLLWQIVLANLQVARTILGRDDIDPVLIDFDFPLDCDVTKVTLGNSITLTPGTLTVRIDGDHFIVHALNQETAASLFSGEMQRRVASVFGHALAHCPPPTVRRQLLPSDRN